MSLTPDKLYSVFELIHRAKVFTEVKALEDGSKVTLPPAFTTEEVVLVWYKFNGDEL